jgi:regulator of sigma E protease
MISTILLFLLVLSLLVLAHECGHFLTALALRVKVEEFGVGFPPRLFAFVKRGVRYSINAIPLGGFVKIKGETGEHRLDPDSFASKSLFRRFLILVAGVFMNIVLAAVLFSVGFMVGVPQALEGALPPSARVESRAVTVTQVLSESPAEIAGIHPGDEVVSVDQHVFPDATALRAYIQQESGEGVDILIRRGGEEISFLLTGAFQPETDGRMLIGVGLLDTGIVSYPWYVAPLKGIQATATYTAATVQAFGDLIGDLLHRAPPAVELSGPVGIAVMTGEVAQLGFAYLLQFTALLSINLAIINVFPLPALDGGRVLFLMLEKFRGAPICSRVEGMVHSIGFAVLMGLVLFVTYRDVLKLFE